MESMTGKEESTVNDYRGKHISSAPWVSSAPSYRGRHRIRNRRHRKWYILVLVLVLQLFAQLMVKNNGHINLLPIKALSGRLTRADPFFSPE